MKNIKILYVLCGIVLTAVGIMIIPLIMRKLTNQIYKKSCRLKKIDFDKLGPDIINKSKDEEE